MGYIHIHKAFIKYDWQRRHLFFLITICQRHPALQPAILPTSSWRGPRYLGTPKERQRTVSALHAKGYQLHEVARRLSVDVQTVRRDKRKLSLETWSTISDAELDSHVEASIALAHTAVGIQKMGAYLLRQGLRVQDHRVKAALVSRSTAA